MAFIQIRNTNLDSNNWVDLNGAMFTPGYRRRNNSRPLDGQVDTSTSAFQIAKADRSGVENPVFIIQGVINLDDFAHLNEHIWRTNPSAATITDVSGATMAGSVTLGYLLKLDFDAVGDTYIKLNFGSQNVNWVKHDFSYPLVTSAGGDLDIPVEIDAIDFSPSGDTLHIWNYSITCREVRR